MKKFMTRSLSDYNFVPHSLKYNVWYHIGTPWDSHYFKLSKKSKVVHLYDFIEDKTPSITFSKKRFVAEGLFYAKMHVEEVDMLDYYAYLNY